MKVNPARAERFRREHAEYLARMRTATARPHASRRTRIRLSVGLLAAIVGVGAALFAEGLWTIAAMFGAYAVTGALWFALRRATSLVTEAPDEVLDELHVRLRNVYYRDAYRIFGGVVAVVLAALAGVSLVPGLAERVTTAVVVPVILVASVLPMIVAAFRMPDVDAGD